MPNGKPGDRPYTDIVVHGLRVSSATADALVREIATLADEGTRRQLAAMLFQRYNEHERPDVRRPGGERPGHCTWSWPATSWPPPAPRRSTTNAPMGMRSPVRSLTTDP
jgi:hypothetical protein